MVSSTIRRNQGSGNLFRHHPIPLGCDILYAIYATRIVIGRIMATVAIPELMVACSFGILRRSAGQRRIEHLVSSTSTRSEMSIPELIITTEQLLEKLSICFPDEVPEMAVQWCRGVPPTPP